MANTIVQIKRSTTTQTPPNSSLAAGELAISYASNKLFSGNSDGIGVIEVGGKLYVDLTKFAAQTANAAFDKANTGTSGTTVIGVSDAANAAFAQANTARTLANAAFDKANSANLLAFNTGIGANAFTSATIAGANAAVGAGANAFTSATIAGANAAVGAGANSYASAVGVAANTYSNATFLNRLTGGTVGGDLVVTGNATFSGTITYANTQTLLIGDNILTLNADLPSTVAPSENAGLEVNRGSSANVALRWNETTDRWEFTNDGTNYSNIASAADVTSGSTVASLAFDKANSANLLAFNTGIGANAFTSATIAGANTAVGAGANAYSRVFANTVGDSANAYTRVFANTVGDSANAYSRVFANAVGVSANAFASATIAGANTAVGAGANAFASATIAGANTAVGAGANAYSLAITQGANANAANGSYISTGIVKVPFGGTGMVTFTQNGILFGNSAGDLKVTAAGTEGKVLQASVSGVPVFDNVDGGVF